MEGRVERVRPVIERRQQEDSPRTYRRPVRTYRRARIGVKDMDSDVLAVQVTVSGILLIIVLFVAIVRTPQTTALKERLSGVLSSNTSITSVKNSLATAKRALSGMSSSVNELLGSEILPAPEKEAVPAYSPVPNDVKTEPITKTVDDSAVISDETLESINETIGVTPKNQ